jgi:hypothetical protein
LVVPNVACNHSGYTTAKQDIGETTGRSANVKGDLAQHIEGTEVI